MIFYECEIQRLITTYSCYFRLLETIHFIMGEIFVIYVVKYHL